MSIAPTATVSTTRDVRLAPSLRTRLLARFRQYARLKTQLDALKAEMDREKGEIAKLREQTGEQSLKLEGFTATLVAGTRKVLNHKKLIALGCAAAWIDEATEICPNKPYEKITTPNDEPETTTSRFPEERR